MLPRVPTFCHIAAALVFGVAGPAAGLVAQTPSRSPFLPPQASGPAAPTQGAPLEFRGYMVSREGTQYRIYDPARKAGAWVKLNERNPDFDLVAKQHDETHKTLTIEHQGKTLTLAERESKIVSAGSAPQALPPPPAAPAPATNVAPAVTQAVVLNPTPADEQRRLEAVAAEVARRRALREQASQQVSQPQPSATKQMGTSPAGAIPPANQRTPSPR